MKKELENFFGRNTYTNDWLHRKYQRVRKEYIEKKSAELSLCDTIEDPFMLTEYLDEIHNGGMPYWSYDVNATESRMYGIHGSIFHGIEDRSVYFPSTEHGLILHDKNWSDTIATVRAGCVTFGEFRKTILRRYYDTPIYCVGPYIHYAEDYYTPAQMEEKKKILGRNLLVFPTHGTDNADITYQDKTFLGRILEEKKGFDSVTVCMFWWNLQNPIVQALQKEGFRIVCAGYREDPKFLSRLKAIIDLSDFVMGDGIGTNIGYCVERGKPFCYFDSGTEKKDFDLQNDAEAEFKNRQEQTIAAAFLDAREIGEKQEEVYRFYWGGDQLKSPDEIRAIYQINKEITLRSKGSAKRYAKEAGKLLDEYRISNDAYYRILKDALE